MYMNFIYIFLPLVLYTNSTAEEKKQQQLAISSDLVISHGTSA